MKTFAVACVFLAVAITALPADDVVAEALPADMAPETDLYVEQLHKEASAEVASLIEAGKTKDACASLAASSKKEITDGQRNTQRLLNRMDVGKNCHTAGLAAYNAAKNSEGNAKTNYNSAKKAASKAKSAPIKFRQPVTVSMVKTSGCLDVSKDPDYIKAKKATSSASNKATMEKGKVDNAKKATSNALKAHQKAKVDCACRAQKNYKAAVKAANNFNSAKNAKAWTKAHHMECVLNGKPANKCAVPSVPRVTTHRMPSWVARTKCSSSPTPAPPAQATPATAPALAAGTGAGTKCTMYNKDNKGGSIGLPRNSACNLRDYHGCHVKANGWAKIADRGGCCNSQGYFHKRCHCSKATRVDCQAMCQKDSGCLGWVSVGRHGCQWATVSSGC